MFEWILIIYFFSEALFFGTKAMFFATSVEGEVSNFGYFNILLVSLVILVLFVRIIQYLMKKDRGIQFSKIVISLVVIILLIGILLGISRFNHSDYIVQQWIYFLSFVIPAVTLGMLVKEKNLLGIFSKLKIVNVYLSICFLVSLINSTGQSFDMFHDLAGATHLTIGYAMSAMFGFNLLCFLHQPKFVSKLFYLALMILNVSIILFSGSRGALVSIVVALGVSFFLYIIRKRKFVQALALSLVFILTIPVLVSNENFSFAIERIMAGFSKEGDQSTSERKQLYNIAFENFYESPIIGNGIGSYSHEIGRYYYPHNLFLEILNDFGLIGILILLPFLLILFKKCLWLLKQNSYQGHVFVFLFINVFVQLMFSASYLSSIQFWILVTIILCFKRKEYMIAEIRLNKIDYTGKEHLNMN